MLILYAHDYCSGENIKYRKIKKNDVKMHWTDKDVTIVFCV